MISAFCVQRRIFWFISFLVMSALAGCGGGGSSPLPVAPAIITPPASLIVKTGQTASFSVTATGDAPLSYQWLRSGAEVPGANGSTYILANTALSDHASTWNVRVSNSAGTVLSNGATLSVNTDGTLTHLAGTYRPGPLVLGGGVVLDSWGNLFYFESPASAGGSSRVTLSLYRYSTSGVLSKLDIPTAGLLDGEASGVPAGLAIDGANRLHIAFERNRFAAAFLLGLLRVTPTGHLQSPVLDPWSSITVAAAPTLTGLRAALAADAEGNTFVNIRNIQKFSLQNVGSAVTPEFPPLAVDSMALGPDRSLYFAHTFNIFKVAPGSQDATHLAGSWAEGSVDGIGGQASFKFSSAQSLPTTITALAVDSKSNVYAADSGNHTIRKITPAGVVTTVAGRPGIAGLETGPLPGLLTSPTGLVLSGDNTLYVLSAGALLRIALP